MLKRSISMPGHTQKYELSSIEEAYAHTSPRNVLKMKEIEFAQPNNLKLGCQSDSTSDETDDDTISYLDEENSPLEENRGSEEAIYLEYLDETAERALKKRKIFESTCDELTTTDFSEFCSRAELPKHASAVEIEAGIKSRHEIKSMLLLSSEAFIKEVLSM